MKKFAIIAMPLLILSACADNSGEKAEKEAATGENLTISADGDGGNVSIKGGGISVSADLPGLDEIDANTDFDIDGVKLYPGAKITSFNLGVDGDRPEGKQGVVRFGLSAPAAPATVLNWYSKAFAARGVTTSVKGSVLNGTSKDGDVFSISLTPEGSGSKGEIKITG